MEVALLFSGNFSKNSFLKIILKIDLLKKYFQE